MWYLITCPVCACIITFIFCTVGDHRDFKTSAVWALFVFSIVTVGMICDLCERVGRPVEIKRVKKNKIYRLLGQVKCKGETIILVQFGAFDPIMIKLQAPLVRDDIDWISMVPFYDHLGTPDNDFVEIRFQTKGGEHGRQQMPCRKK